MTRPERPTPEEQHYSLHGLPVQSRLRVRSLPRRSPSPGSTEVVLLGSEGQECEPASGLDFETLLETSRAETEERSVFRLGRARLDSSDVDRLSWDRLMDIEFHTRRIKIRVRPGSPRREVEARLLGPATAYLLERNGRLALHASALAIEGQALVVAGAQGVGKSTFLAAGLAAGGRLLADDLTAVSLPEGGEIEVPPGPATLRLAPDVALRFGLRASRSALRRGKLQIRLPDQELAAHRLAALILLETSGSAQPHVERVAATEAFPRLQALSYVGPEVARRAGFEGPRFLALSRLLTEVPTYRLTLPRDLDALSRVVAGVLSRSLVAAGS